MYSWENGFSLRKLWLLYCIIQCREWIYVFINGENAKIVRGTFCVPKREKRLAGLHMFDIFIELNYILRHKKYVLGGWRIKSAVRCWWWIWTRAVSCRVTDTLCKYTFCVRTNIIIWTFQMCQIQWKLIEFNCISIPQSCILHAPTHPEFIHWKNKI